MNKLHLEMNMTRKAAKVHMAPAGRVTFLLTDPAFLQHSQAPRVLLGESPVSWQTRQVGAEMVLDLMGLR